MVRMGAPAVSSRQCAAVSTAPGAIRLPVHSSTLVGCTLTARNTTNGYVTLGAGTWCGSSGERVCGNERACVSQKKVVCAQHVEAKQQRHTRQKPCGHPLPAPVVCGGARTVWPPTMRASSSARRRGERPAGRGPRGERQTGTKVVGVCKTGTQGEPARKGAQDARLRWTASRRGRQQQRACAAQRAPSAPAAPPAPVVGDRSRVGAGTPSPGGGCGASFSPARALATPGAVPRRRSQVMGTEGTARTALHALARGGQGMPAAAPTWQSASLQV